MYNQLVPMFGNRETAFLEAVSKVAFCNPFTEDLAKLERKALGADYAEQPPVWSVEVVDPNKRRENSWKITGKIDALSRETARRLAHNAQPSPRELELYEDATLYALFHQFHSRLFDAVFGAVQSEAVRIRFYPEFLQAWRERMEPAGIALPSGHRPAHTLACFFQIVRAFNHIFLNIIGGSWPAARLRAEVWQSIFTHDIRRYRRTFFDRMGDFATLITGPSGTGKELVARAIALSRYIPFDERSQSFRHEPASFHAINIPSLSSTLVESELFGHRRGSFTGAIGDRRGWLEACPPLGAVFLDEIGELSLDVQVKLLRVIETRSFTPVGGTKLQRFDGKLIAATNRNLPESIAARTFREDLYYRLCSDMIATPSLAEQVRQTPGVLKELVQFMARRNAATDADSVAAEAYEWIESNLGLDYEWPGNYRELEQCVRNIIVRREYRPVRRPKLKRAGDLFDAASEGRLTADELLRRYCTLVYSQAGSYEEAARRLGLDRRTVKARVDRTLLEELGFTPSDCS